jgi:hypothetical protein
VLPDYYSPDFEPIENFWHNNRDQYKFGNFLDIDERDRETHNAIKNMFGT